MISYLKDLTKTTEGGVTGRPQKDLASRVPTNTEGDADFYDIKDVNTTLIGVGAIGSENE